MPASTKNAAAAQKFVNWATSKAYIQLVAQGRGLGARAHRHAQVDLRERPSSRRPPSFAAAEKAAIDSANPLDSTLPKSPYTGVQFATIPEFQSIGVTVGQQMSAALAGKETVDAALKASQVAADREMKKAGYYK